VQAGGDGQSDGGVEGDESQDDNPFGCCELLEDNDRDGGDLRNCVCLPQDAGSELATTRNGIHHCGNQQDTDVASKHQHGHGGGHQAFMHQDKEESAQQQLVRDGVEIMAEDRALLQHASEDPIESIGKPGGYEESEAKREVVLQDRGDQEGRQADAYDRKKIGSGAERVPAGVGGLCHRFVMLKDRADAAQFSDRYKLRCALELRSATRQSYMVQHCEVEARVNVRTSSLDACDRLSSNVAMLPGTPQFEAAVAILKTLRMEGYEAYLAGGCVRDLLLGREPQDYDVTTSATPEVVLGMFPRAFGVGAHFGVVLVASEIGSGCKEGAVEERCVTEVATFRNDGVYSDGRHPDEVRYTKTAAEDVQRRDFTINGLLLDPLREGKPLEETFADVHNLRAAVLDHVGGLGDLDAGVIRAIGRPERRFEEDRLRLLRAVRFAARFGFEIEPVSFAAMRKLAARIHGVSRERIREELTKMLTEGRARRAFELLDATDLLVQVLPEVSRMKGVQQPPQFHPEGDVWIHTLMLLEQLEAGCPTTLAWGALLHDGGKPPTYREAPDRIRFDGHVDVGVAIGGEICRRFRFSNEETRQILALIQNHMRFADAPRMKASTLKRFFRLENFPEHLDLHRMDCMAAHRNLDIYEFVRERYESMAEEEVRPSPLLTGRDLIAAGYAPGPLFKEMLQTVEDAQLEGAITTPEGAMALVREKFGSA